MKWPRAIEEIWKFSFISFLKLLKGERIEKKDALKVFLVALRSSAVKPAKNDVLWLLKEPNVAGGRLILRPKKNTP